ncbi:hypothetical protein BBAD15_g8863 [Beauveria bassiana D1-5]|uniref:Uncharacterized protein n=1 Tax=Beauveria bassiana D1-5 TaxID=1245745 RepID=A0A0A2VHT0_BEABA|nr:hypothetical protein BBAD15_g8863 [Beauveria bassiana D1-5]
MGPSQKQPFVSAVSGHESALLPGVWGNGARLILRKEGIGNEKVHDDHGDASEYGADEEGGDDTKVVHVDGRTTCAPKQLGEMREDEVEGERVVERDGGWKIEGEAG